MKFFFFQLPASPPLLLSSANRFSAMDDTASSSFRPPPAQPLENPVRLSPPHKPEGTWNSHGVSLSGVSFYCPPFKFPSVKPSHDRSGAMAVFSTDLGARSVAVMDSQTRPALARSGRGMASSRLVPSFLKAQP